MFHDNTLPDFLFFWGHTAKKDVGPFVFSQWFPSPFSLHDLNFATAEHYMMWRKAILFGDRQMQKAILECTDPEQAKAYGRKVQHFSPSIWDVHKIAAVLEGNMAKFTQNPVIKNYLLSTHPKILVEASPYDSIWGIGKRAHPSMCDPRKWKGENLLGFVLMSVRDQLRSQQKLHASTSV